MADTKVLYKTNANDSARYVLGKYQNNPLVFFGINPSTSTLNKQDTTISIVENIAYKFGYDGYIMLNLCPIKATKIHDNLFKLYTEQAMAENLECIKAVIRENQNVVAAWGCHITDSRFFCKHLLKWIKLLLPQMLTGYASPKQSRDIRITQQGLLMHKWH